MKGQKGASVPKGRRGHTTLVHRGSALIYGGYCDLRGSSNEFWIFHFGKQQRQRHHFRWPLPATLFHLRAFSVHAV